MTEQGGIPRAEPSGQSLSTFDASTFGPRADDPRSEVASGTPLFEQDTPATNIYFLHEGQVRLFLPGSPGSGISTRLLEILGPGDWFGSPALAGSKAYGIRAVAVTRAKLTVLPVNLVISRLQESPAMAVGLIRHLAARLAAARQDAGTLVFEDTNARLIKTLLQFSKTAAATPEEDGQGVILRITHQQLAQAVGAARETVSLALTQLRHRNVLKTGRNRLWFNPQVLQEFAQNQKAGGKVEPSAAGQNSAAE
jgi:CRP/FNR family transcriptional regulator